jgi:predicted nucleic acid-binding protein
MELIDTSAWVEYFRATGSPANLEVRRLLQERPASVVTTEPVVMELLAGAADERVSQQIEILTGGLRLLPVEAMLDYRNAALTYRAARRRGLTVRKLFDCLIATVAARTGATLVHRDRYFDALADALPDLRVRSLI